MAARRAEGALAQEDRLADTAAVFGPQGARPPIVCLIASLDAYLASSAESGVH